MAALDLAACVVLLILITPLLADYPAMNLALFPMSGINQRSAGLSYRKGVQMLQQPHGTRSHSRKSCSVLFEKAGTTALRYRLLLRKSRNCANLFAESAAPALLAL